MEIDRGQRTVVCGAGGFIGGHLIADLRRQGYTRLRAVDLKPPERWYQRFPDVENVRLDLREPEACRSAVREAAIVYNLAADMGGMGFIELNKALQAGSGGGAALDAAAAKVTDYLKQAGYYD